MDPNKFYCRNAAQPTTSTSSISSGTSSIIGCGSNAPQEYAGCDATHAPVDSNCKELLSRNAASKSLFNQRGTNATSSIGGASSSAYCNNNSGGTGNYINVMPVPMGTLQYHRRKLTPQEYQSRLYYNSADYRSRDDYYGGGRINNSSPSPSLQLQNQQHYGAHGQQQFQKQQHQHQNQQHLLQQHQQQNQEEQQHQDQQPQEQQQQPQQQQQQQQEQQQPQQQQHQQQQQQQHQHQHQQQQQQQQQQQHQHQQQQQQHHHHQQQSHSHSINHAQHSGQLQHQHQHQPACNSNITADVIDEALSCGLAEGNCGRVTVASTQTQHNGVNCSSNGSTNCDQLAVSPSITLGTAAVSMSAPIAPSHMLYTVHRVVTTAQIQTAAGNTFASSSSVSSVVSAVRSETDCAADAAPNGVSSFNSSCLVAGVGATGSTSNSGDSGNTFLNNGAMSGSTVGCLRNSPGVSTNINFLSHHTPKGNHAPDVPQHSAPRLSNNYNTTALSSSNCLSGAKTSTLIPRPLQNVIPTCVYLMSRVAVHMEIEGTAQCPTQVMLAAALGCEELGIANKLLAQSIFGLWMTSALLEIQLKSHHRPYVVRVAWQRLLEKFSNGNPIAKEFDEPMIVLKRNVFFSKRDEEKIKDHRILELLYEEAKHNVLSGRYIMEPIHALMLGGIQARIELGPYNLHTHTISFFRENQSRFLPQHVAKSSSWSWLPISRTNSAEMKLWEQFKRVPQTATTRKLMRKYLEFCWALPFYGAAFFQGQVEQPVRGLMSLVNHKDVEVSVAINERGVFVIDPVECTLLLGLRYEDLSWDFAKPSANDDPECLTCVFIQFDAVENGIQVSKLVQIFSKQAAMIDALISHFAEQMRKRKQEENASEQFHDEPNPIQNNGNGVLCNKLSRLTLATFDDEGRCIGQMGSLSISY